MGQRKSKDCDLLPRFPQPFLDRLRDWAAWEDALSLVSTCKREAPMRVYWINEQSAIVLRAIAEKGDRRAALARFPRCRVRCDAKFPHRFAWLALQRLADGPYEGRFVCDMCWYRPVFNSTARYDEHICAKHVARLLTNQTKNNIES